MPLLLSLLLWLNNYQMYPIRNHFKTCFNGSSYATGRGTVSCEFY